MAVLLGRRKIYYGWWLLATSVVAMAFGSGVSFWAFGLYVKPLEAEFGWSRAQVSLGFSVALLVSGVVGPAVGWWIDSRGARSAVLIGAVLTALTYVLLATTSTLWQWYLFQSINAVFRQMMFFIPFQSLVSKWFDRKRGVALSVLATGFSLGGFVVVPIMSLVISRVGWAGSFVFSGVATAVVFLPIGLFVLKDSPADVGAQADGEPAPAEDEPPPEPPAGIPLGAAIRTPLFWVLAAGLSLFFYGMFGWLVHQIPFYESVGISRSSASLLVSAAAGLGIITRLSFGMLADRVPRFEVLAIGLGAFLATSMAVLLVYSGPAGIALFLVLWVVGAGGGPMMEALLLTRAFGVAYFATILGAVVVVETIGQILSPTLAGAIFDSTGSYDWALVMYVGTFLMSISLFYVALKLPRPLLEGSSSKPA
ncbi:MAG: MFS transporter [Dehalococcoidia bacterium]